MFEFQGLRDRHETKPRRELAQVASLGGRAGGHIQEIRVLLFALACTSFNDIAGRRHRSTPQLRLQTVALFNGEVVGGLVDVRNERVREIEDAEFSVVATHVASRSTNRAEDLAAGHEPWALGLTVSSSPQSGNRRSGR